MKRSQTFYSTIQANATEQQFTPSFFDKARVQSFDEVVLGITTAGIYITVYYGGKKIAQYDATRFGTAHGCGYFDLVVPADQQLSYSLTDISGTGAANVPVTFVYNIPTGSDNTNG